MRNTNNDNKNNAAAIFFLTLGTVVPTAIMAEPVTIEAYTAIRYSDNMSQNSDANAESDVEYRPGVRINHVKDPGQCNSALGADFAYLIYQEGTQNDSTAANLNWNGDCRITPYLYWRASDRLTETARDTRGTNTVSNRERKNVFSTGPQVVLPLTDVDSLLGGINWEKSNFEDRTENNSERWVANARLRRSFSPVMQAWLGTTYSDAEFDNGRELRVTSYRAGLSRQLVRTQISGDIGISTLERETVGGGSAETEGLVWNIRASHDLNKLGASVYASVARDLTDVANDVEIAFGDVRFNFTETQAVELTSFTVGGSMMLDQGYSLNASVYAQEYEYLGTDEVEEMAGATVGVTRALSSVLSAFGTLRYERQDFQPESSTANEYGALLGLSYQRTRDLSFNLSIGHETQDGTGRLAEYDENWITATVNYDLR